MTNPGQNNPTAPPANPARKQRHGCLTALLIVIIVLNVLGVLSSVLIAMGYISDILGQDFVLPVWSLTVSIISSVFVIIFAVAIFMWKKWGFWGLVGIEVVNIAAGVVSGDIFTIVSSVLGAFIAIGLLYATLQIGGQNKGWTQLE
jgi:hypothetical protein